MTKNILIADDELDFIELLRYRFRDWGYKLHEGENGTDALNKIWAHIPDLILLDLLLPDLSGLTLTEILQRQDSNRETKVTESSPLRLQIATCSRLSIRADRLQTIVLSKISALKFKSSRAIRIVRTRAGVVRKAAPVFLWSRE